MALFALPTLLPLPLLHPRPHKFDFGALRLGNSLWRQMRRRLVGKQAVLVPVMHTFVDENERLADGAFPLRQPDPVRRGVSPGVPLSVDNGQARVADMDSAVLVDALNLRGGGDVEGFAADDRGVLEVDKARNKWELVGWDS